VSAPLGRTFRDMALVDEGCRIVICDDQAGFRQVMSTLLGLESNFHVVGEAGDGREAIDLVGELEPDVLLLDIAMPRMDGIEALPHIRLASPDTHVLMVTGFGSESVRRRALEAGASGFIEKGIDVDELITRVKDACAGRG
jgi:DNA-binding NarL/FixJ family response regulator